jgi:hypothetical protein
MTSPKDASSFYTPEKVASLIEHMEPDLKSAVVLGACSMNYTMFIKNLETCLLANAILADNFLKEKDGEPVKIIVKAEEFLAEIYGLADAPAKVATK